MGVFARATVMLYHEVSEKTQSKAEMTQRWTTQGEAVRGDAA